MNDIRQYETASAQLATVRDSEERDRALDLTRRLKALYTERKAALDAIVAPLRERIDDAKRQARLEDIEGFSRRVLAAVADYDKRQAAAKAAEATARLAATTATLAGAPAVQVPQAEPVKPVATRKDIIITAIDADQLPRQYMTPDEGAIKRALKIGEQIPGVKWEWKESPIWTK